MILIISMKKQFRSWGSSDLSYFIYKLIYFINNPIESILNDIKII